MGTAADILTVRHKKFYMSPWHVKNESFDFVKKINVKLHCQLRTIVGYEVDHMQYSISVNWHLIIKLIEIFK